MNHIDNLLKMILKFEIIIYCSILSYARQLEAEIFSKDFVKKDHDNKQDKIEVRGAHKLLDELNLAKMDLQISFIAQIPSGLMRMALGHA
jgi:hypothetical protein